MSFGYQPLSTVKTVGILPPAGERTSATRPVSTGPADIDGQPTESSLPLLVTGVLAEHEYDTAAANNFAFIANPLDACPNLHHTRDAIASHLTALENQLTWTL